MNNIDRFLRVFYKDCNLKRLFEYYENGKNLDECFSLYNKECKKRILTDYQWLYPDNYNYDALENMYAFYSNPFSKLTDRYIDAICLLEKCTQEMLDEKDNEILVKKEHILHWDGILNKIDSNVLIGLKCASLKAEDSPIHSYSLVSNQKSTVLNYISNDEKITFPDKETYFAENHMHLKGSGYTTEMNMCAVLHTPISYVEKLEKDIASIHYNDKTFGFTNEEVVENFRKIKLLRLFIFDLMQDAPILKAKHRCELIKSSFAYSKKEFSSLLQKIESDLELYQDNILKDNSIIEIKRYYVLSRCFFQDAFELAINGRLKNNSEFHYLLNMYICGITKLRFLFAQDNNGMGFERFKRYENRKENFIGNIVIKNIDIYSSVFDKYISESNISKIEFRVAPPSSSKNFAILLKELDSVYQVEKAKLNKEQTDESSQTIFNYGITIHFIKSKEKKDLEVSPSYFRYEVYLNKQQRYLNTLLSIFERGDWQSVKKIVGIDTANYEIDCPPEVFAGIYSELSQYHIQRKNTENDEKSRLYKTYHVGEDFCTISTGIRRINEAIDFLDLKADDRLGHAIAVGLDVKQYFSTTRNLISCKTIEWIDDLAWMHHIISIQKIIVQRDIYLYYLKSEFNNAIAELNKELSLFEHEESITIEEYYKSTQQRGNWIKSSEEKRLSLEEKDFYLRAYFKSTKFYQYGERPFVKEIDFIYIKCVELAQEQLVNTIIDKEIIIEANPSSNRKISCIHKNEDLPIIQMLKKFAIRSAWKNLCINTDDSAIFQTNLHNEYMIVYNYLEQYHWENLVAEMAKRSCDQSFIK